MFPRSFSKNKKDASGATPSKSLKQNTLWMMVGNAYYAVCQWLVLIIIARLGGPEDVGVFTLALAVTAPVIMFFALGMRPILASDVRQSHGFSAYLVVKATSVAAGFLICLGIAAWYGSPTCWTIIVIAFAKTIESVSDMCYGYAQQERQLNRISISLILKGTISTALLAVIYAVTKNLTLAVCAYSMSWLIVLLFYDRHSIHAALGAFDEKTRASIKALYLIGIPMGITGLMILLGQNIPRYVLENSFGSAELGIYASMVYFITVGNVLVMAFCQAIVPVLARYYEDQDEKKLKHLVLNAAAGIFVLGLCGVGIAHLMGAFVLNLVYGPAFALYADVLPLVAVAAAISYLGELFRHVNAATKIFVAQAPAFIFVASVSLIGSLLLIPGRGLIGAIYALILTSMASCAASFFLGFIQKKKNRRLMNERSLARQTLLSEEEHLS